MHVSIKLTITRWLVVQYIYIFIEIEFCDTFLSMYQHKCLHYFIQDKCTRTCMHALLPTHVHTYIRTLLSERYIKWLLLYRSVKYCACHSSRNFYLYIRVFYAHYIAIPLRVKCYLIFFFLLCCCRTDVIFIQLIYYYSLSISLTIYQEIFNSKIAWFISYIWPNNVVVLKLFFLLCMYAH